MNSNLMVFLSYLGILPEVIDELYGICPQIFSYEEEKIIQRREGHQTTVVKETYKKYAHPDTGAIHLLLKNLDPNWHNDDAKTIEIKQKQLEIAKEKAEANNW